MNRSLITPPHRTMKLNNNSVDESKRNFVRKAAYIAPAIITMTAMPSFASAGSGNPRNPGSKPVTSSGQLRNTRRGNMRERKDY